MLSDQCNTCLAEMTIRSEKVHQEIKEKASIIYESVQIRTDEFFEKQSVKHDEFFERMEKRIDRLTVVNLSLLGMFALAIAYIFVVQQTKANASEVISTETFKNIMKISDNYKDQRFVMRPDQKFDEAQYQITIETLLERNTRGIKTVILPDNKK